MAKIKAPSVGEFIAAQRRSAELSLRQLSELAGVSNPYLSQIERGLRKPSAEVLQQLAKALRVSAETLYVRAGILDPADHPTTSVEMAILADPAISERQKGVLVEVYASFVEQNEAGSTAAEAEPAPPVAEPPARPARKRAAARKSTPASKTSTAKPRTSTAKPKPPSPR